jgi:hypothetical protein
MIGIVGSTGLIGGYLKTVRPHRPYYHVTDISVHKDIANYYINEINKT